RRAATSPSRAIPLLPATVVAPLLGDNIVISIFLSFPNTQNQMWPTWQHLIDHPVLGKRGFQPDFRPSVVGTTVQSSMTNCRWDGKFRTISKIQPQIVGIKRFVNSLSSRRDAEFVRKPDIF